MVIRLTRVFYFLETDYIDKQFLTNVWISVSLLMLCYLNEIK